VGSAHHLDFRQFLFDKYLRLTTRGWIERSETQHHQSIELRV
jgi:hypothetical protein